MRIRSLPRQLWPLLLLFTLGAALMPPVQGATVGERLTEHGDAARARLVPAFHQAQMEYPPEQVALIGLKDEALLQVYVRAAKSDPWVHLTDYPILAASGGPGPKLREGDGQVPEGVYRVELLNPNSKFHLSMRLNYPNAKDRAHAKTDGRTTLGGDIMIHGNQVSIGCLAMGDVAIEELFVLAADTGLPQVTVLIAPRDFRAHGIPQPPANAPAWVPALWDDLADRLRAFPHRDVAS